MICGKVEGPTEVILTFPKYRLAHISAALTFLVLIGLWIWGFIRLRWRPRESEIQEAD